MSKSLGTLTLDLVARIGGFSQGMDEAARISARKAREIAAAQKRLAADIEAGWASVTKVIAGGIAGITIGSTFAKFIQETRDAEQEQAQLAAVLRSTGEAAGWSQEQLNAMASELASTSIFSEGDINKAQTRMLSYANVAGKQVPEAMQAVLDMSARLGMSLEQSAETIGKALDVPSEGLSALSKQGFRFTEDQKKLVEQLEKTGRTADAQRIILAALESSYGGAAAAARNTFGGAITALQNQLNSLMTGSDGSLAGTTTAVNNLTNSLGSTAAKQAFADFTNGMAVIIQKIAEASVEFARGIRYSNGFFDAIQKYGTANPWKTPQEQIAGLRQEIEGLESSGKKFSWMWTPEQQAANKAAIRGAQQQIGYYQDVINTQNENANAARRLFAQTDPRRLGNVGTIAQQTAPPLPSGGGGGGNVKPPKGGGNSGAQEAAAQIAADLDAIKNSRDALLNTYRNSEQVLQAMRSAGLTEEREYYAQKRDLMDKQSAAEVKALEQTIARLQQEQLSGKGEIDNTKKIASAQAELARVREDAATQSKVLSIEEEAAFKRVESSILAAKQAAQGYLDTLNRGLTAELEGAGMGNKARERSSRATALEEQYERQRQDLLNLRRQAEMNGSFGPEAEKQYQQQLQIINDGNAAALQALTSFYTKVDELQKDWKVGALEALANYFDETQNIAKQTEDIVTNAFKGMEDALVEFTKTGKLDMKSLVDSIMADFARMAIRSQITGPLAGLMSGAIKGSGSSGGSGGGWLSSLLSAASGWFGGARANGGPVEAGRLYQVGERGDELYSANGKQYLIPGADGTITPNNRLGNGGGFVQNLEIKIDGTPNRRTIDQTANEVSRRSRLAQRLA